MRLAGVGDVFGFRIAVDELLQGQQRLQGALLVARHVGDLVVVRHRHDVLRVRRVRGGRVQLQIALRGVDGVLVVLALEMGIGGHEQGFARPIRIRILLLELAELLGGALVVALLHATETLVVELPGGHLRNDLHLVALGLVERVERRQRIASAEQEGAGQAARPCAPELSRSQVGSFRLAHSKSDRGNSRDSSARGRSTCLSVLCPRRPLHRGPFCGLLS